MLHITLVNAVCANPHGSIQPETTAESRIRVDELNRTVVEDEKQE